jgi:hypothetical protein
VEKILPYIILIVSTAGLIFAVLPPETKYRIRVKLGLLKKPDLSLIVKPGGRFDLSKPYHAIALENRGAVTPFPVALELWTTSDWLFNTIYGTTPLKSENVLNQTRIRTYLPRVSNNYEVGYISRNADCPDFDRNAPVYYKLTCAGMVIRGLEKLPMPVKSKPRKAETEESPDS